jgi:hypothetical protein
MSQLFLTSPVDAGRLVCYSPPIVSTPAYLLPSAYISSHDAIRRHYFDLDDDYSGLTIAARCLTYIPTNPPTILNVRTHVERYLRYGRRPPKTITSGTVWSPGSPRAPEIKEVRVDEDHFESEEGDSDDDDDGYRAVTHIEYQARRDAIVSLLLSIDKDIELIR